MVEFAVRRAAPRLGDAEALAAIEAATLGDSDLTVAEMLTRLAEPNQFVYLAQAGEQYIGMLATFETPFPAGPRLELDMLGVSHAWRGRGVARTMVERAVADGRRRGCVTFRAVVATDNAASRSVFERCGLLVEPPPRHLLTRVLLGHEATPVLPGGWSTEWSADLSTGPLWGEDTTWRLSGHAGVGIIDDRGVLVSLLALLRVSTMAYAGFWVEKAWSASEFAARVAMLAAAEQAKSARLDEVGILVPPDDRLLPAALDAGYDLIGTYHCMVAEYRV
ncbi:MAG: GNAT family N-acetyltransferase [Anaerolineae bacterium]